MGPKKARPPPGAIHILHIGNKRTNISVQPDPTWPGMWRIHQGGLYGGAGVEISDMLNLARAKDAALSWLGNRRASGSEKVRWHTRHTPQG